MIGEYATVYALVDPRTEQVRYIGVTVLPLKTRLSQHVCTARKNSFIWDGGKAAWIQELLRLDLSPQIRAIKQVRVSERMEAERTIVAEHIASGAHLLNTLSRVGIRPDEDRLVTARISGTAFERLQYAYPDGADIPHFVGQLIEEALDARSRKGDSRI